MWEMSLGTSYSAVEDLKQYIIALKKVKGIIT
jgi:hypothetical protein